VRSKFLTKDLHRSIQELLLSITHRVFTGTNPDKPFSAFSVFDGFGDSSNVETKSFRLNTRITGIFDGLRINHN